MEDVKNYLVFCTLELVGLTFIEESIVVTHYMEINVLYRKFQEYKYEYKKHGWGFVALK